MLAKEPHTSKVKAKQKKKEIYKTACNLFQDSPRADLASRDNQSFE